MTEQLECGHPKACYAEDEGCLWCDEVESLKRQAQSYRDQLHKKAVILAPGEHDIRCQDIGLLEISGGTVYFLSDQPTNTVSTEPECLICRLTRMAKHQPTNTLSTRLTP